MKKQAISIGHIPAIIWGEPSNHVYLSVHGKMSCKESAQPFAALAVEKGIQTISFDLPEHGERTDREYLCNIWNGIRDLTAVGDYVFANWKTVSLFANSIGAFFSLQAYQERRFERCLFQSPVVDMDWLIHQMFIWFDVSEEALREKKEIPTPVETLSWDYYCYVKEHPIREWTPPTSILYGAKDNLQSRDVIDHFADRFHCQLTVSDSSDHPFMGKDDAPIVTQWLREQI